jgi:hypothetical protein
MISPRRGALSALIVCLSAPFAATAQHQLTVANGAGDGNYAAGERVFVSANPYDTPDAERATWEPVDDATAQTASFLAWQGDTAALDDVRSSETWITMPAADVTIAAVYAPAERWAPPVIWQQIPPNPLGVIFMIHGGLGSTATMAAKAESGIFTQQALVRGYGVVFVESFERNDGEANWSKNPDPTHNYDMQRVASVRQRLIEFEEITEATPLLLWGSRAAVSSRRCSPPTCSRRWTFPSPRRC